MSDVDMRYELHPLCSLFPRMAGAELQALKADIAARGLRQPIVLHNGMVLDGGNRYFACLDTGVEPQFAEFEGDDIAAFVLSANLHRRHMSIGQQAAIVASVQDWTKAQLHGGDRKSDQAAILPLDRIADRIAQSGASERTQRMADRVSRESPELVRQVAHGEVSLPAAIEKITGSRPGTKADESTSLRARVAELEERIAELESEYREVVAENESLSRVLNSNEQVAASMAEAQRFREQARLLNERINGLTGERNQAVRRGEVARA